MLATKTTETAALLALDVVSSVAAEMYDFAFSNGAVREISSSTVLSVDFIGADADDDLSF